MNTMSAMERYREEFFSHHPPIAIRDLRPGMKIVVPDNPNDYGGGDVFMEVTELRPLSSGQISIVGKLIEAHSTIGNAGSDVVAVSPFEHVGKL